VRGLAAAALLLLPSVAHAGGTNLPPFDFENSFYLANGIDPTAILGRPTGTGPNSIIDNTPNGPNFNNIRLLDQTAAFDHSGHAIFFSVTGIIPSTAAFTNNAAGVHARQVADEFKVYEFPRAANAQFATFPKRQDLLADLRNGYFSNDPLGVWQINYVRYTPAATGTQAGQQALASLAQQNGVDLDGTPVIKKIDEIESLLQAGFVIIETPPVDGPALRWFFCPVIEDPRDGAIAPDAHLTIVSLANGQPLPAQSEHFNEFHCLQTTGDFCGGNGFSGTIATFCGGATAACPCSAGAANAGCVNSSGQGGRLVASGTARIGTDSVVLQGTQMTNSSVLYIQGSTQVNAAFGDGARCAGGTVVRLGQRTNTGGSSSFPSAGVRLSDVGHAIAGQTLAYQAWYRDAASFCTTSTFNLTNGVRITWGL
jgi:hypothetical protein